MTDIRSRLTDALREHASWAVPMRDDAERIADVLLSLPGIAIVEVEEQDIDDCCLEIRGKIIADTSPAQSYRPIGARKFAAALLAAAAAAEANPEV